MLYTERFNEIIKQAEYLSQLEDDYIKYLDDTYGKVSICGIEYQASQVFKEIDLTAYELGMQEWEYHENERLRSEDYGYEYEH